ncbi:ExeM/NucH family extracellular endonuclease [Rhodopirellula halodulae]|uniref:ExeM/NucH family extracellular endonuclease n=1 Tax=Rhodopirellula halodulae TaxID=2894198 RepID=UPI001E3C346B|nr:ExeM/NucH family extracellular endonuclease [Rhodopirellula sp. JC737]MCC9654509.1 ExeM/NucH family extracellular endonuclease [Rhodopirellula sp. JC737]
MTASRRFLLTTASIRWLVGLLLVVGCKPASNPVAKPESVAEPAKTNVEPIASTDSAIADTPSFRPSADAIVIDGALNEIDWDSLVGKRVIVRGDLTIVDTYNLIRRGQVDVARERLYVPTSIVDPNDKDPKLNSYEGGNNVAQVTQAQKLNDTATITLDDGSAEQNIFPPKLFPNLGGGLATVRLGSTIKDVSGKVVLAGSKLLLVADQPLNWTPAPRPPRPDVGNAEVTVASFNVLNYFTTIDDGNNNARGADSYAELQRQEAKIVSAMIALKADVIGLMELENNLEAEQRLVDALNQAIGQEIFRGCGLPDGFAKAPGGNDAIRVGMIYRSDRVSTIGDVTMIRDDAFGVARTPIVQTFQAVSGQAVSGQAVSGQAVSGGDPFTVVVNHFKSKGGASNAPKANQNKGDGQGAYNASRRAQSLAITDFVRSLKVDEQEPRVLIIGDFNAYQQEDPVDALRAMGLIDLHEHQRASETDSGSYSYVYYGQAGSLDHAFATPALANSVTGVAAWHINADEPRSLDYNQEYNPSELFREDPYRSSDHDPVLIGIGD